MSSLSPEVQQRLHGAQQIEEQYLPNQEILELIHRTDFIAVIAAAAMGKSTVMNAAVLIDERFRRVGGGTTREPAPRDEPGQLRYVPHTDEGVSGLLDRIDRGELVQYMVHPTTGNIYYTEPTDYSEDHFNMKDVTTSGLELFRRLGFKSLHAIGITAQPVMWHHWFTSRYPGVSEERSKRLREAILSTEAQQDVPDLLLVENRNGDPDSAAKEIIALATSPGEVINPDKGILERLLITMRSMG